MLNDCLSRYGGICLQERKKNHERFLWLQLQRLKERLLEQDDSNQKRLHSAASKQFEATKWSWNWINEASLWQCNCSMSYKAYAREVMAAWLWFVLVTSICFSICLYTRGWFGNKLWNVSTCSNWGSLIELCWNDPINNRFLDGGGSVQLLKGKSMSL